MVDSKLVYVGLGALVVGYVAGVIKQRMKQAREVVATGSEGSAYLKKLSSLKWRAATWPELVLAVNEPLTTDALSVKGMFSVSGDDGSADMWDLGQMTDAQFAALNIDPCIKVHDFGGGVRAICRPANTYSAASIADAAARARGLSRT